MPLDNAAADTASDSTTQAAGKGDNTFTSVWSSVSQWVGEVASNVTMPKVPQLSLAGFPTFDMPAVPQIGMPIPSFSTPDVMPGTKLQQPEVQIPGIKLPGLKVEDEDKQIDVDAYDDERDEVTTGDEGNGLPYPGANIDSIFDQWEYEQNRADGNYSRKDPDDDGSDRGIRPDAGNEQPRAPRPGSNIDDIMDEILRKNPSGGR